MRGERETSWERMNVLVIPSLVLLRSWRDSPTVRSRGNNLIGLRSQPLVPRRCFILLPRCRLSFSFSRVLVILSRLTPRVEDRRPRIECPLVKLDPYHDPFLSELLIVRLSEVDCIVPNDDFRSRKVAGLPTLIFLVPNR